MASETTPPTAVPSQKRPLEEPSSETDVNDQPEAKRPALDNIARENGAAKAEAEPAAVTAAANGDADETSTKPKEDANDDTTVSAIPTASEVLETQPIQSTASGSGAATDATFQDKHQDETGWLHIRSIISSTEAATVIGKGGENVTLIRRLSGAKCTVSDYTRGAVERILTVSGLVDAAAKAFGLIIRTLNNEDIEAPSTAQSKTYPLRLLIPHILIGSIIGQKGVRIREIQEASGARLNASDACLPLSTERSLVVLGVADAVHIATYYVGSTLHEQLTERFGGPAASAYATRSGGPAGVVPGGMQVVPYTPQPVYGQWGAPDRYNRSQPPVPRPAPNAYGLPYAPPPHAHVQPQMAYAASPRAGYQAGVPQAQPQAYGHPAMAPQQGSQMPAQGGAALPGQALTQQIFIPNDMVGAIIGKGGAKINEIRQLSGSVIKINEPQDNSNERLVTITGTQDANQMALYMLYQRLESEKHRI